MQLHHMNTYQINFIKREVHLENGKVFVDTDLIYQYFHYCTVGENMVKFKITRLLQQQDNKKMNTNDEHFNMYKTKNSHHGKCYHLDKLVNPNLFSQQKLTRLLLTISAVCTGSC